MYTCTSGITILICVHVCSLWTSTLLSLLYRPTPFGNYCRPTGKQIVQVGKGISTTAVVSRICDPLRRNHTSALFHDIQFVTSSASLTLAGHGDIFRLAIGFTFAKLQRPECNTCKIRNTCYKRFAISPLMNSVHKHLNVHSRPANM